MASPSAANISKREYIYFIPHPPPPGTPLPYSLGLPSHNPLNLPSTCFEPTSTLVLTTPNNTFVDIRLFKPTHPSSITPLPNKSEPGRLEWAFAGSSASVGVKKSGKWEGKVSHSTWTHWVDSRCPVGTAIPTDEGDMYALDGEGELTLEVGHAYHPALGRVSGHEEMWKDVAVHAVPDLTPTSTTTTASGDIPAQGKKIAVTLRFSDTQSQIRGLIVRVGQFCQGILMNGGEVTVERWEFCPPTLPQQQPEPSLLTTTETAKEEGKEDDGIVDGWKRTARIGTGFLPCSATFRPKVLSVGGVVRYGEFGWGVEEIWGW